MIAIMGMGTTMAFRVSIKRFRERTHHFKVPKGANATLILTLVMMLSYIDAFIGKVVTSINAVDAFRSN